MYSHFRAGGLTQATFQGINREKVPSAYMRVDIVLTTYSTMMAYFRDTKTLFGVRWFRVVLDEGILPYSAHLLYR